MSKTGYESYIIHRLGRNIRHGTSRNFDIEMWKNLRGGSKFGIGPFVDIKEAEQALDFYDLKKVYDFESGETTVPKSVDKNKEIYFFTLQVNKRKRSRAYELMRVPGAIKLNQSYEQFIEFIAAGVNLKRIAIGPFWSNEQAELAKKLYRATGRDK